MKKVKVSHKGRVCKVRHCKIILSIYNHDTLCYLHQDKIGTQMALKAAR